MLVGNNTKLLVPKVAASSLFHPLDYFSVLVRRSGLERHGFKFWRKSPTIGFPVHEEDISETHFFPFPRSEGLSSGYPLGYGTQIHAWILYWKFNDGPFFGRQLHQAALVVFT